VLHSALVGGVATLFYVAIAWARPNRCSTRLPTARRASEVPSAARTVSFVLPSGKLAGKLWCTGSPRWRSLWTQR